MHSVTLNHTPDNSEESFNIQNPVDHGREFSIAPPHVKILGVVSVLFAVTLIVLAYYTGKGSLHAPDCVTTGLKYSAWIIGGGHAIGIPLFIDHYFREKKQYQLRTELERARVHEVLSNDPLPITPLTPYQSGNSGFQDFPRNEDSD